MRISAGGAALSVRLIDSVGYLVDGAAGADEEGHVVPRTGPELVSRFGAVWDTAVVAEIQYVFLRKLFAELRQRGQSAESGIEYAYGPVVHDTLLPDLRY